jgi:hypothetical protein
LIIRSDGNVSCVDLKTLTICEDCSAAVVENLGKIGGFAVQYILSCDGRSRCVADGPVDDDISRGSEDTRNDTVSVRWSSDGCERVFCKKLIKGCVCDVVT